MNKLILTFTLLIWASLSSFAFAIEEEEVGDIGVAEQIGESIPLDVTFTTITGEVITFGQITDLGKPIVVVPVYYNCPRICTLIHDGLDVTLQSLSRVRLGEDFVMVSVSIGPEDSIADAQEIAEKHRNRLGKSLHDGRAWLFLTGEAPSITSTMAALGYRYKKDGDDYAHPAAIMVLTPEGTVARYLYGLSFTAKDFGLAILEAASGTIKATPIVDRVLMYCYKYDPEAKEYVLVAQRVMTIGGYITLTLMVLFLGTMWLRDRVRKER